MKIPFDMPDTEAVNAASPCCCPQSPCYYASIQYQSRDSETCKGGFLAYAKDSWDNSESAFDYYSVGKLVPVYKTSTDTVHMTISGTNSENYEYTSAHVVLGTYKWESSTQFDFTRTTSSEWGKPLDEWPAGSQPLGACPPEDVVFAGNASAGEVIISATDDPDDDLVEVTLTTPDVRPDHPTEVDGEGNPAKAGSYEWLVDWQDYSSAEPELTILLNKDDATCHEFRVRHVCGGNGPWSKAKVFSAKANPCCKEPEKSNGCDEEATTSNEQWSNSQKYLVDSGEQTWTSTDSDLGEQTGKIDGCDGSNAPDNYPSVFIPQQALSWINDANADSVTTGRTQSTQTTTWEWNVDDTYPRSVADPEAPDPPGWRYAGGHEKGTAKKVGKTERSNDQNQGASTVDGLFSRLLGTVKAYAKSYGWAGSWSAARATGGYPESDCGSSGRGDIFAHIREVRFRWKVSDSHDGNLYKTQWDIGRFHDRWITWRGEYYDWAVAKYDFLHKPKPGDDDYPKLSDFFNDPDTPENEARESLDAAIAAINAITDPGSAPAEPTELKPEILSSPDAWTWNSTQGEQPEEFIDACDPTKYARELHEPERPKREDYGTDEQFANAVEGYKSALASYKAAVAARKEASKKQSPWFFIDTPDKWSDYREKPSPVQPLPEDPDEYDKLAHERATKRYNFLLEKFNSTHHASNVVCNVRHTCNIGDPSGEIENWDLNFPTTDLPPLSPAKEDPRQWSGWFG